MKHGGAGWSGTSAITCFLSEAYRERRLASSSHTEATANALHKRFVSSSFPMYFPYVCSLCKAHTHTHLLSHILSLVPRCSLSTRCQVSSTCSRSTLRPLAQHRVAIMPRCVPSALPPSAFRPLTAALHTLRRRRRVLRAAHCPRLCPTMELCCCLRRPQCRAAGAPSSQALSSDAGKDAGCGCFIIAQQHYETGILSSE